MTTREESPKRPLALTGGAVLAVRIYQRLVSPLLPATCRYVPSCSEYAAQALLRHGFVRGLWYAAARVVRCHPWADSYAAAVVTNPNVAPNCCVAGGADTSAKVAELTGKAAGAAEPLRLGLRGLYTLRFRKRGATAESVLKVRLLGVKARLAPPAAPLPTALDQNPPTNFPLQLFQPPQLFWSQLFSPRLFLNFEF